MGHNNFSIVEWFNFLARFQNRPNFFAKVKEVPNLNLKAWFHTLLQRSHSVRALSVSGAIAEQIPQAWEEIHSI